MKIQIALAAMALLAAPVLAHASCDAVKSSIDAKIKANGVSNFTLTVEPSGQSATDGKVVGQCEGDKQIVYAKGAAAGDKQVIYTNDAAKHAAKGAKAEPAKASSGG